MGQAAVRRVGAAIVVPLSLLAAGCLVETNVLQVDPFLSPLTDPVCQGTLMGLDLRTATIADLQAGLAAGTFTSVDLVKAYTKRIETLDNRWNESADLNGVRMINPHALDEAARLDAERAAGNVRGPMHGIPLMMKDNIGTSDMPTTAGSSALGQNFPIKDAGLVTKLRENGVLLLGKLELLEWANWGAPSNGSSVGGPQHNAYNGRSASASSSGPGVAGSMAYGAIALGSETSGSILGPTQTNSLAGLKTTHGFVSGAGVIPIGHWFDVVGPMGRNVYDLAATMDAMAGTDPDDRFSVDADSNVPPGGFASLLSNDALRGVRLGYNAETNNELFLGALKTLEALGAELVPIEVDGPATGVGAAEFAVLPNEFHYEINEYLQKEANPALPFKTWHELMAYNRENHADSHPAGASGLALASAATPGNGPLADLTAELAVMEARRAAQAIFDDNDIAAVVSYGSPFTSLGAAAGHPTVMIPLGYTDDTPRGISWFGPRFSDGYLLSYAYAFEQVTKARIVPELFNPDVLDGLCPGLQLPAKIPPPPPEQRDLPTAEERALSGWMPRLDWV